MARGRLLIGLWVVVWGACGFCGAAEKVAIRFAPPVGASHYVKTIVKQKVTRIFKGNEERSEFEQGFGEEMTVLQVGADGSRTIRSTYRWIKYHRKAEDGEVSYDSAAGEREIPAVCLGYAALVGEGFVFKVSGDGEISGLAGLKRMGERIRAKLPAGLLGDELMRDVRRYVDAKTVAESLETGFGLYPTEPVAVGEQWSEQSVQFQDGGGIRDSKMTLLSIDGDIAEISVKSRFSPNPKAPPVDWGQILAKFEMTGTESGTIRLDLTTGVGLGTKLEHELTGYTILVNPDRPDDEEEIPLTLKGTTTIEVEPYEPDSDDQAVEQYVKGVTRRR